MKRTVTVIVASCLSATAFAADPIFDVRTAYMGGAGVAGQRSTAGIQLNPANLALPNPGDKWGLTFPVISAGVDDPENLKGTIDTIQNTDISQVNTDITQIQNYANTNPAYIVTPGSPASPYMTNLGNTATSLSNQLRQSNSDQVFGNVGLGTGLAIPGKKLGFDLDVKASVQIAGKNEVSNQDLNLLDEMSNVFTKGYVTASDRLQFPDLFSGGFSPANYQSSSMASIVGLGMGEVGMSFAHQYELGDGELLAVGLKPKLLELRTYDYTALFNSNNGSNNSGSSGGGFKTSDFRNNETSTSMFNADAGVTLEADDHWRLAATVENGIKKDLTTVTGRVIALEPKYTAGVAFDSKFFNWSLDADLHRQTSLGFNTDSQIIATGVELNAWNFLRFGVGFRHNMVASSIIKDVATAGASTSLLGLNLGVAAYGRPHEVGGAVQLSLEY